MIEDFNIFDLLYLQDLEDLYDWGGFSWRLCLKKVIQHHQNTPFPQRMKQHPDFFEYYHMIKCYEENQ